MSSLVLDWLINLLCFAVLAGVVLLVWYVLCWSWKAIWWGCCTTLGWLAGEEDTDG